MEICWKILPISRCFLVDQSFGAGPGESSWYLWHDQNSWRLRISWAKTKSGGQQKPRISKTEPGKLWGQQNRICSYYSLIKPEILCTFEVLWCFFCSSTYGCNIHHPTHSCTIDQALHSANPVPTQLAAASAAAQNAQATAVLLDFCGRQKSGGPLILRSLCGSRPCNKHCPTCHGQVTIDGYMGLVGVYSVWSSCHPTTCLMNI